MASSCTTSVVYQALCHFSSLGTKSALTITYSNVRPIARLNVEGVSENLHCELQQVSYNMAPWVLS